VAKHNELGKKGEDAAVAHLEQQGHAIVARNYRFGKAEIDIISQDGNAIVFTEVKTRSTDYFGYPEEAVDSKKRMLMKKAAEEFIYQHRIDADIRFDVISLTEQNGQLKIHHFKDAFFYEGPGSEEKEYDP